jgi:hypothetical protein
MAAPESLTERLAPEHTRDAILEKALGHLTERLAVVRQRADPWIRVDTLHLSALLAYVHRLERGLASAVAARREGEVAAHAMASECESRVRDLHAAACAVQDTGARLHYLRERRCAWWVPPGRRRSWMADVGEARAAYHLAINAYDKTAAETLTWVHGDELPEPPAPKAAA